MSEAKYTVVVGNVGQVCHTESERWAREQFGAYVSLSKAGRGRVGGESVSLFHGEELVEGYMGHLDDVGDVTDGE